VPLKRPVTLPQARRWPAAAKRRQSFCARMGGMRELLTGERAARDPASPINRALAAWDCDEPELLRAEHVSKGIRMKITKGKVGSESGRRNNPEIVKKIGKFNVRYSGGKVEFYDSRYTEGFTPLGQFVTRYDARSLIERPRGPLALDLGIPAWTVTADQFEEVRAMVARSGDFGPVLNPARKRAAPARKTPAPASKTTTYAVVQIGRRVPVAVFANKADAVKFGQSWADIHKAPVQVIAG